MTFWRSCRARSRAGARTLGTLERADPLLCMGLSIVCSPGVPLAELVLMRVVVEASLVFPLPTTIFLAGVRRLMLGERELNCETERKVLESEMSEMSLA